MKLTEFFRAQLDREVERSRKALEQVPEGQFNWKPHEKSMIFGYLANMVATIPMWISMEIDRDELDVAPPAGQETRQPPRETKEALLQGLEETAAGARAALEKTTDEHLMTTWKLLAHGNVVWQGTREEIIQDTISHWSHHRGQMTVYLRLMGAKVPAIFGPSADDQSF
jgi:uncharacterized damage-inducible protein DinB